MRWDLRQSLSLQSRFGQFSHVCGWLNTLSSALCFLRRQLAEQQLAFEGLRDEYFNTVGYSNLIESQIPWLLFWSEEVIVVFIISINKEATVRWFGTGQTRRSTDAGLHPSWFDLWFPGTTCRGHPLILLFWIFIKGTHPLIRTLLPAAVTTSKVLFIGPHHHWRGN